MLNLQEDILFKPLSFRNLTIKNRILRSSVSGRLDHYDGSGTRVRINWERKFARGGVGAIISSFVPVSIEGRILPNFATIHADKTIPFWKALVRRVHDYDCKYIIQLSHSGRQQDIGGIENRTKTPGSSTSKTESVHGLQCHAMTRVEIEKVIKEFADGAWRAREAGADGVELHGSHGYLITQFLSSGINDRRDEYGGSLENRSRFLLEIVRAIRSRVGRDFHLQVKINATDYNNAVYFWHKPGNTVAETIRICQWLEQEGVDAIHISTGSSFPHPLNPPGQFPLEELSKTYGSMLSWGRDAFRNYLFFRFGPLRPLFLLFWNRIKIVKPQIEGVNLEDSRRVKEQVRIPVMVTGGFQTASVIRKAIAERACDAVTITRALIANPDLVQILRQGKNRPDKPCTYCNKCLVNVLEHPIGCYDLTRFDGDYERMVHEIFSIFDPETASQKICSLITWQSRQFFNTY